MGKALDVSLWFPYDRGLQNVTRKLLVARGPIGDSSPRHTWPIGCEVILIILFCILIIIKPVFDCWGLLYERIFRSAAQLCLQRLLWKQLSSAVHKDHQLLSNCEFANSFSLYAVFLFRPMQKSDQIFFVNLNRSMDNRLPCYNKFWDF